MPLDVAISNYRDPWGKALREQRANVKKERSAKALCHYAALLQLDGRPQRALAWLDRCLDGYPGDDYALYLKALTLMQLGDWQTGLRLFEHRLAVFASDLTADNLAPRWRGETTDKRVLIWQEGGYGDVIHLLRFIPEVVKRAPNLTLCVDRRLVRLLHANNIPARVIAADGIESPAELQCSIQSLPLVMQARPDNIDGAPYLIVPQDVKAHWHERLRGHPKIGFCWRGSPRHERDATRSIPHDVAMAFGEKLQLLSLLPETTGVSDWLDTAGIIANLDLVISVDTAVAHLAGAMGIKTFLLLPVDSDWRWLRDRSNTPWYDAMILFRCERHGEWPLDRVYNLAVAEVRSM